MTLGRIRQTLGGSLLLVKYHTRKQEGQMSYLELQGVRLFYERQGDGNPPLVFVHGIACNHDDWQLQVDFFGTQYSVITCDLRGHGASDSDPERCNIETYGADITALLSALELPPAILIGHSMGCRVVLEAYLDAPQQVAALILIEGSRVSTGERQVAEQTTRQMVESLGYTTILRRLFNDMFLEGSNPAFKQRILTQALAQPEEVGANLLPRLFGWDAGRMELALAQVAVPMLILQSTYINTDRVRIPLQPGVTTPWFELVRQHVPTAQIEIVSGVRHFPMLEAPEVVNQTLATFIAKVAS
jgi:pimeloyl-ACP methyl ester carboxylesterase